MENIYKSTLIKWCDKLCDLQITNRPEPYFFGAVHCPACGRFHGRIGDSVYPLLTAAKLTGDMKYATAAENAFTWAEKNVLRDNGSFFNDQNSGWAGVTTFLCTSIAEALNTCGEVINDGFKERLKLRLKNGVDFCYDFIPPSSTVINYKLSIAGALAATVKALDDESYMIKAKEIVKKAPHYFAEADGLLWGEHADFQHCDGDDAIEIISKKGCRAVDIGYDVEETIPSLCLYAEIAEDEEFKLFLKKALSDHLYFMLRDGGWDNSFGIRMAKWTYWGSRTSDGCQGAYGRFAYMDPKFPEVAHRSFMQYLDCTADGLLHGGPMYIEEGQPPCTHHTFCHAKSAADMVNFGFTYNGYTPLPFDENCYKYFPSADLHLLKQGQWRVSVSGFDLPAPDFKYSTGLTLLQQDNYGTVFAASMPSYFLEEANNMQYQTYNTYAPFETSECQTPRLISVTPSGYSNIYDRECVIAYNEEENSFKIEGQLKNKKFEGDIDYALSLQIADTFTLTAKAVEETYLVLPVVAGSKDKVLIDGNTLTVERNGCILTLKSNCEITSDYKENLRNFNPCGGFATYPVKIHIPKGNEARVEIKIN